ncbi:serine/threonine protein kinase [Nocardioides sp. GXQ0305]|uniref:serine/threonine protein kinase n=1 Tax=Nocardioides sp. GXQ0305 TaxID=3423912 RepID=UPI003D7E9106
MSDTNNAPERFADPARRYRLDDRIATGGMGEVWRATDTRLGRTVAVKLLKDEYADDATFRTRFTTEAQHAAALHHPGVASVYDYGGGDATHPYLVMELVDGQPLSALIAPDRPMDPEVVRDLMAQAADAIGAAHAAGIVHRDVKPANLLITPDRRVKITDFGIARAAEGMALTQTGQVMGTPQYLSPEQAQGQTAVPASDVYSLGVVAFECLTGRRPFGGETPVATALAHLREPVPDLPADVPADLAAVVKRAMSKDPADRFPDAAALAAAFRDPGTAVLAATAVAAAAPATQVMTGTAPVPPPGEPTDDRKRRNPWPWILLALLAVAAVVLIVLLTTGDDEPTDNDNDPNRDRQPSQDASQDPSPTETTTPETTPPPEETTSAEPETFDIDEGDYLGRDVDEVQGELSGLGLSPTTQEVENDGTQEENTVASVSPTSGLQEGDEVVVEYYGAAPADTPGPPETPPGQEKKQEDDQ